MPSQSSPLLVGLDIGSTNIKAVVFEPNGAIVARSSHKTPTHFPRPGWAYFEPAELWATTVAALREAIAQVGEPERIASIGVASVGESGVLLDAHDTPLYEAIAWYDIRSEAQGEELARRLGEERVYATCGIPPQAIFTLAKLLWIKQNEPKVLARAVRWLHVADYITYRLCGVAATDYSLASRTLALNLRRLEWATDLIEEAGIPPQIFAPLKRGGTYLGTVLPEIARLTGLPAHTVVSVGGHDHLCGALAVGAGVPGVLLDSIGTAEGLLITIERPLQGEGMAEQGYEQGAHVAGGYYGMGAYRTAGVCIDWFRGVCGGISYADLTAEAAEAPPGSLGVRFMPHLRLPHSPSNDPKSRGTFVGLSTDVTRGMLFRAIIEGLSFETRAVLEPLLRYAGVEKLDQVYVIGGASRNPLLVQTKADILNETLTVVNMEEEVATGAALLGGLAAGIYAGPQEAAAALNLKRTQVHPNPELAAYYDRIFTEVYANLYEALRPINHANHPLRLAPGQDESHG